MRDGKAASAAFLLSRLSREEKMKQYIVDAFTNVPGRGNPAAVCLLEDWPAAELMQQLARKNGLSETAFLVKDAEGYRIRWFTPENEEVLCGHATLASSFVLFSFIEPEKERLHFYSRSGELTVTRRGAFYEMDFPTYPLEEIPVTDEMERAFGVRPVKAIMSLDLICVFETEEQVRALKPDQARLLKLAGRGQNATARGREFDCVSRSFFPIDDIAEDPVCGSAHCQIAAYWSKVLGKREIEAYQASERGGTLHCTLLENGRILISGEAVLERTEEIEFPLTDWREAD